MIHSFIKLYYLNTLLEKNENYNNPQNFIKLKLHIEQSLLFMKTVLVPTFNY